MTTDEAKQYFTKLHITDWEAREIWKSGGQGTTVKVFNPRSREWGVFKMPKKGSLKELERFKREIEILVEIGNKNMGVVPLLARSDSQPSPWYISKLGTPFKEYWLQFREAHATEPEIVFRTAIAFIRHLLSGLSELHERSDAILHRDIKPDNIVVIDGLPNLIDFGVSYWPVKERLTNVDDAVGNKRYSPDIMMNRIEDPTPWLDVYMMAQVFMWMLSDKPVKNWERPVDFRFVHYSHFAEYLPKIHAFTGACCESSVGPSNARQMLELLDRLFYQPAPPVVSNIQQIVATAQRTEKKESELLAMQLQEKLKTNMKYEALRSLVANNIVIINDLVEQFVETIRTAGLTAQIERRNDDAIDHMFDLMNANEAKHGQWGKEMIAVAITVGGGSRTVQFGLTVNIHLDHADRMDNPFYFSIVQLLRYERNVYMSRNGELYDDFALHKKLQPADIINMIKALLEDESSWEAYP